jgi:hypothetical protein
VILCVALASAMMARSSFDVRERADMQDHRRPRTWRLPITACAVSCLRTRCLTFLFNTTVLALAINVGASLA